MTTELSKVTFAVLRVFIDAFNKQNNCTFHLDDVNNEVCRALHRGSRKEKKQTRPFVLTTLRALVAKKILFAGRDDWSDDKLARPKPLEVKDVYGLTYAAIDYMTLAKDGPYSIKSKTGLEKLLAAFDVAPEPEQEPAPSATLTPKKPVIKTSTENTNIVTTTTVKPDVASVSRALSRIKNLSAAWRNLSTPTCLLACLKTAQAYDAESATSSAKTDWYVRRYQEAADLLIAEGLAETEKRTHTADGVTTTRNYGLWLTPLGAAVVEVGAFTDNRPDTEPRFSAGTKHTEEKTGSMLKNSKKQTPATTPPTTSGDFIRVMIGGQVVTVHKDDVPKLAAQAEQTTAEETATGPRAKMTLPLDRTIAFVVTGMTNALCKVVSDLAVTEIAPGQNAEDVDNVALYHSLTKFQEVVSAMKHALRECLKSQQTFPAQAMLDYSSQVALDMEELAAGRARKITLLSLESARPDLPGLNIKNKNLEKVLWTEVQEFVGK